MESIVYFDAEISVDDHLELPPDLPFLIRTLCRGKLCENADIPALIEHSPLRSGADWRE